jgi:dTDP-glucose pyrophosphorylase
MFERFLINGDITIKEAMRNMNDIGEKTLFIVDSGRKLLGALTDGDIRRWILKEGDLSDRVKSVFNRESISISLGYNIDQVKEVMINNRIEHLPVVGGQNEILEVLAWEDVFGKKKDKHKPKIDIPAIIMAGGKGTRLDPFTRILPKPLIPIGEKAVIDIILEKFIDNGIDTFFMTINHKSKMIKSYFEERSLKYNITYLEEDIPLGTIGGIKLAEQKVKGTIIVSNCDIIVDCDYVEILDFHKENANDITLVGSFRHFVIPYGVCEISKGGELTSIKEKPEYDFWVNTGMSMLEKRILDLIPDNRPFDITDLVNKVKTGGGKVGVFPLNEKAWIDIGQWDEYRKSVKLLGGA